MLHILIEGIRMSIKRFADAWGLKHAGLILGMVATGFAPTGLAEPMPLSAPINPDFVQHQMMLGASSIQQATVGRAKGYIPSPFDRSHMSGLTPVAANTATMSTLGVANVYPSSFDLRSLGKVTSIKQQGVCGSCWTFASEASTESNTLVGGGGIYDFSENHLNVRHGFDGLPCAGGNGDMAGAYMTRWGGALAAGLVYESDDPYTSTVATSVQGLSPRVHLQEYLLLPDRVSGADNNNYKYAIQNYGAVTVAFYVDSGASTSSSSAYWNQATHSYYYNGSATTNHLVALVGWDDNYPASNFSTAPPGNGAFIVKNSWGTGWGNSGYFYISYYDVVLGYAHVFRKPESAANYARSYLYDPFGQTSSFGYGSNIGWGANVFTAVASESLRAVALNTLAVNTSYEVYIYTGVSSTPLTGILEGGAVNTTGSFSYAGYHTIALSRPVPLVAGQKFAVVVKFTTPGYSWPVPMEYQFLGYNSAASASAGQSFVSSNGATWSDLTTYYPNANVNLRAFTGTAAPCTYTLGSAGLSAGSAAVIGNVSVTAAPGCAWTAVRNAAWITITSGASGSGNGSVGYSVALNTTASSRTGTLTIAGKTFTVTQNGAGTLPAAPAIGVATAGNGSVRVAFTPMAIGSGTLLNYTAMCGSITATGTSPIMVPGLANGTAYTCKVRTTSTVGIGPWSALSNTVTPSAALLLPAAPIIGTATAGNGTARVAFSPGAIGSGTLLNYTAMCGSITATGTSPIMVLGLTNGVAYSCKVRTTSTVGIGPWSALRSVTPSAALLLPAAPIIGVATAGNGTARIAFTPMAIGSGTLLSYTAMCGNRTAAGTSSPITVPGLINGTPYSCKVRTTSTVGIGPWSALSNAVIPSATPLSACTAISPAAPSVVRGSASPLLTATCNNSPAAYVWKVGATTLPCTGVTCTVPAAYLAAAGTYTVTVRANNAAGAGTQAASATITVSTQPLSACTAILPAAVSVVRGSASPALTATCSNTPTAWVWRLNGAAIPGCATTASTCIVPAASIPTAGASYTVTVTANNAGGTGTQAASRAITVTTTAVPSCTAITPATVSVTVGSPSPALSATCTNSPVAYVWKVGATTLPCTGATCTVPAAYLAAAGTYTVTVRANNAAGAGTQAASATVTVTTQLLPSAPAIGMATAGNASARVAFTPGAIGSGTLLNYTAMCGSITAAGTSSPITVLGLTNGTAYTCKVRTTSTVGIGPWSALSNAVTPGAAPIAARIAAGDSHTCALTSAGGVKCWGRGQLTPVSVTGLASGVSAIAVGTAHTCALTSGGGVKCWGNNNYGQLGDNSITQRPTPVDVSGLTSGVVAIAAGDSHTCALTGAGGVKCWGYNIDGQVGDNSTTVSLLTPVTVTGLSSGVRAISAGGFHTCALTSGGGMKCWGYNGQGQLGDDSTLKRPTPVDVSGLTSGVSAIAAGRLHTCALTSSGGVKCWGYNSHGQLGDNSMVNQLIPANVSGLTSGVSALALGVQHTCALTSGGGVKCWGNNTTGQLGDNSNTKRLTPVGTSGLNSGVSALAAGARHTCALTSAGGAKCWGDNFLGQLGDNTTTTRFAPVNVSGF